MLDLDLLSLLDPFLIHQTLFVNDEVIQSSSSIDSICLLELFRVRQTVQEEEELWVVLLIVNGARQCVHLLFNFTHRLLHIES